MTEIPIARVLVTGATGLLGRQVMKEFSAERWQVRGLCFSRSGPKLVKCDLSDPKVATAQVMDFRPHIVIHCAAERRPDVVQKNPEKAKALNVDASIALAQACARTGAWFIYLSTDYVFDGTSPPYHVDAKPNPLNDYGLQKVAAEEQVILAAPQHAVLRVPLLYGPAEFLSESSVSDLFGKLLESLKKADHGQKRYPTFTPDAARILLRMAEVHCEGKSLSGVYHWQANECLTKYQMVEIMGRVTGTDISGVSADTLPPACPRPEDSRLDCSRLEKDLGIASTAASFRTPFAKAIRNVLAPFLIQNTFERVYGCDRRVISKGELIDTMLSLNPDLSRRNVEEMYVIAAGRDCAEMDYQEFVKWVYA